MITKVFTKVNTMSSALLETVINMFIDNGIQVKNQVKTKVSIWKKWRSSNSKTLWLSFVTNLNKDVEKIAANIDSQYWSTVYKHIKNIWKADFTIDIGIVRMVDAIGEKLIHIAIEDYCDIIINKDNMRLANIKHMTHYVQDRLTNNICKDGLQRVWRTKLMLVPTNFVVNKFC
jgi:hypothetical protein